MSPKPIHSGWGNPPDGKGKQELPGGPISNGVTSIDQLSTIVSIVNYTPFPFPAVN